MQEQIEEILTRGVANIIPGKKELEELLLSGKKLNIYIGADPTATHLHLGNAVPLRKLQKFLELGHKVTFLIGDFTALVGDTSDKESERPILTSEEIEANFKDYQKQAEKILDFSKVTIVHNSDWLKKLTFAEIIKLTQQFSLNDFISRELIAKRLKEGKHIRLDETLYPLMQGYDSYVMDTDIQLGGTDQTFNMQAGRILQRKLRDKESFVMTNPFLSGTDGRKMSKSWGNGVWLDEEPNSMYGKLMAMNDDLIIEYATLGSNMPLSQINELKKRLDSGENPMTVKKDVAAYIVTELHDSESAQTAAAHFEQTVQKKELPTDIPEVAITTDDGLISYVDLLVETNLAGSRGEAKRLIEQGGVEIDNDRITDVNGETTLTDSVLVKVGKRNFVKVSKK